MRGGGRWGGSLRLSSMDDLDRLRKHGPQPAVPDPLRERDIQPAVLEALRKHPRVAWVARQNTGAGMLITRDVFERLVRSGALRREEARFVRFGWKGQLDNTGQMRDGRRLDVETKTAAGRLSPDQAATMEAVRGAGGVAFVARGVEDVFKEIPL